MIPSSWINTILNAISYLVNFFDNVASFVETVAYYSSYIPAVGSSLNSLFLSIASAFSWVADRIYTARYYVNYILTTINNAIADLLDLWNAVYGWITDKLDDAYYWALDAWDWIVDTGQYLWNDVYGWISDKLEVAYSWARNAWDWIEDYAISLWNDVRGWIADKLDIAYTWASDAWDWIVANADKLAEIPALIKSEVLAIIGPVFNLVEFWFDDIQLFFSDPPAYFRKKVDEGPLSLSEALWAVVERILERIW